MLPSEIRTTREALGLSQGDLAKLMETDQANISAMENGRRLPPERFVLLMEAFRSGWRPAKGWPPTADERAALRRAKKRRRSRA